jgi:hypothetical protein
VFTTQKPTWSNTVTEFDQCSEYTAASVIKIPTLRGKAKQAGKILLPRLAAAIKSSFCSAKIFATRNEAEKAGIEFAKKWFDDSKANL